ncbi:unnamed protein product [Discosporangium mesarthrocarpum]
MWPIFSCCNGGWLGGGEGLHGERAALNSDTLPNTMPISTESWELVSRAWDRYLEVCRAQGEALLLEGVYSVEVFTCQDPGMFVGLPGVALLSCLYRSIDEGVDGIVMSPELHLTERNRPSIQLIQTIWAPLQAVRLEMIAKELSPTERSYLREFVASGGGVTSRRGDGREWQVCSGVKVLQHLLWHLKRLSGSCMEHETFQRA